MVSFHNIVDMCTAFIFCGYTTLLLIKKYSADYILDCYFGWKTHVEPYNSALICNRWNWANVAKLRE